ncbi:MAG: beta-propeller domain-containing protein [Bifidobacteriaceae bacterium]|jgi:uncharacterized secreted protein with C-terminal beta-propeller domain|nr:beta-propeller domain-containing protein [Bifidobacteriaceae bacterium]
MTKETFRDMAEQMKPSAEARAALFEALDRQDAAEAGVGAGAEAGAGAEVAGRPGPAQHNVPPTARRRGRTRRVLGMPLPAFASALAGVCAIALIAVAAWPLGPWAGQRLESPPGGGGVAAPAPGGDPIAPEPASDYSAAYDAISAIAEREQAGSGSGGWLAQLFGSGASDSAGGDSESLASAGGSEALGAGAMPAEVPATAASGDYSETNVQVKGIDEGDIVKTDGQSIFIASGDMSVAIVLPDGAETRTLATLPIEPDLRNWLDAHDSQVELEQFGPISDMLLSGGVLAVVVSAMEYWVPMVGDYAESDRASQDETLVLLYDVSQPSAPTHLASLSQTGTYVSSRLMDGVLYVVSDHWVYTGQAIAKEEPATYVPCVADEDQREPLDPASIAVLPNPSSPRYAVATSIDAKSGERLGEVAVLGGADVIYMSLQNLYLAGPDWAAESSTTNLARVSLDDGDLTVAAQAAVAGTPLNQFALDEFEGHLRIVTTGQHTPSNKVEEQMMGWVDFVRLAVLDAALNQVGLVEPLVIDESVQSVRFIGPTAYVVTFKQVDPLFAVDLSDPTAPAVLSELKIPGFSSYLHPWGEGQLLGFGFGGTEDGLTGYLKLSMFDVSNPADVLETDSLDIYYNHSAAAYDHRAIWADPARGLIGFQAGNIGNGFAVFSYGDAGFVQVAELALPIAASADDLVTTVRGVQVAENLYVCAPGGVRVYTLASYQEVARITF